MNSLIRKEVRSILPAWLLAMALATIPVWIVWPGPYGVMLEELGMLVFAPFGLGVLVLSLTPFGQELNWGTFSVLLSQPVSRGRLWLVKTLVLAVALGCAFIAFSISNHLRVDSALEAMKHTVWRNAFDHPGARSQFFIKQIEETRRTTAQDTVLIGGLAVAAGFAGGLWTTLLFRQVTAAFWLTFLVPMGLTVLAGSVLKSVPDAIARAGLALILVTYSAIGFLWAKRFFLRMQDTQWTGGIIALPNLSELAARQGSRTVRRRAKPIRALLRKEFQAQQVNVLLAGGLLLVHLGVIALRRWGTEYLATHPALAMTLEMVPLLWLAIPLLVGSVAVAEERKLGMFQSTLCLPASRRAQFLAKLVIATVLGIGSGVVLPLLVERLATHTSITGSPSGSTFLGEIARMAFRDIGGWGGGPRDLTFLGENVPIEYLQFWGSLGLSLLAFYGSTLTRNALQAMGAGLLGATIACLVILGAKHAGDSAELILWRGHLVVLIGRPVLILTLLLLAYQNYTKLQPDPRTWVRNGLTLFLTLLCVAAVTTIVYHRAWEAWMPEEPPHRALLDGDSLIGNARVAQSPAQHGPLTKGYLGISIQDLTPSLAKEFKLELSTGALLGYVVPNGPAAKTGLKAGDVVLKFNGKEVRDSQALKLAVEETKPDSKVLMEVLGQGSIRTMDIIVGQLADTQQIVLQPRAPKVVATGFQKAVVLPDGRLWLQQREVQPRSFQVSNRGIVAWYATGPWHTGYVASSDWKDVAIAVGGCFGIRADGTLWDLSATKQGGSPQLVGQAHDWIAISAGWQHFCALKSDGTLWQWGWKQDQTIHILNRLQQIIVAVWQWGWKRDPTIQALSVPKLTDPMEVGTDNDWVAVCDNTWTMSAAIKADGSIWRWDWLSKTHSRPKPWLIGACSEPVSVALSYEAIAMVCADGTLWIGGDLTNSQYARLIGADQARRTAGEMARWGNDSDWKEIRFIGREKAVAIKTDGSLWDWDLQRAFGPNFGWTVQPIMQSRYNDWISVCDDENAFVALARDGSLCLWGDPEGNANIDWKGFPDPGLLLMPSRIKARRIADLAQ